MMDESMKSNKMIGMVQPIISPSKNLSSPKLHSIGCMGKIISFKETNMRHYLIELKGVIRFELVKEVVSNKKYREFEVNFNNFQYDLDDEKEELKFNELELIFKDLKILFEKRGFVVNWKELEKQSLNEIINALSMASPFTMEEKQVLLESKNIEIRKNKIAEILNTYTHDVFDNKTLQ